MSRSTPSLLALLGLVAVAGYQHRGKISEMLKDVQKTPAEAQGAAGRDQGGFLSEIAEMFQSGTAGSTVSRGLNDLVGRFRDAGQGAKAESWVAAGANAPVQAHDLESVLGEETLADLSQKTGLSRAELVQRLQTALPDTVDSLTPEGRIPPELDARTQA